MSLVIAALVLCVAVPMATAGTINLYFAGGCADPVGFNVTPGNPTVWIAPNTGARQAHYATRNLYVYMDVDCRADGLGNEIVSSLGLDIGKTLVSGPATALNATSFTVFTAGTGAGATPWSSPSPNTPTLNSGSLLVSNSRAVAVPASTADALWQGYAPNTGAGTGACGTGGRFNVGGSNGHYRVARLSLATGTGTGAVLPSNYALRMQVGSLKITRVYDPTAAQGATPENVSFGYNGAVPDATVPGNVAGGGSATAVDATVNIRKVGDVGGNDANYDFNPNFPDGQVTGDDVNYAFANYRGTTNPAQIAVADTGGNDANYDFNPDFRDCQVTGDDINFMFANLRGS